MKVADIKVTRARRWDNRRRALDAELLASIRNEGLVDPIVVDPHGVLISGWRRLNAVTALGWPIVKTVMVAGPDEAVAVLHAEGSTAQVPMSFIEKMEFADVLIDVYFSKTAEARQRGGHRRPVLAQAVGLSEGSLNRAWQVWRTSKNPLVSEGERQLAQDLVQEIEAGRTSFTQARNRLMEFQRDAGTRPPIASIEGAAAQRRAIQNAVSTFSGVMFGLNQIRELDPAITEEERLGWLRELSQYRRELQSFIQRARP